MSQLKLKYNHRNCSFSWRNYLSVLHRHEGCRFHSVKLPTPIPSQIKHPTRIPVRLRLPNSCLNLLTMIQQIITHTPQPLLLVHHQTLPPLPTDNLAPNIEFHFNYPACGRNPPSRMDETDLQQPIPLSYNGFGNAGR
jgi:hypothetical protein